MTLRNYLRFLLCTSALLALISPKVQAAATPTRLFTALEAQWILAEQQPRDARVHNDLGNLLLLAGELDEAASAYRQALTLEPEYVDAKFNLALLEQQIGHSRQAYKRLHQVVKQNPDHAWAHYQLGTLLSERKQHARAVEHYARAFRLDPQLSDPKVNPHVVENKLTTWALLAAFRETSPAIATPRVYADSARITDLLIPPVVPPREEKAMEPTPASELPTETPEPAPLADPATPPAAPVVAPEAPQPPAEPAPQPTPSGLLGITPPTGDES